MTKMMTTTRITTTRMMTTRDFYCSQKFWWLTVDIEKMQTLSCCAATPSRINFAELKSNPGNLFNTQQLTNERQQMLKGQQVESCRNTCWSPESRNLSSRRLEMHSNYKTHTDIQSRPEVLHLVLTSDCNMTCVYCCKQYSTAWKKDIVNHGTYPIEVLDDRYTLNDRDKILLKLSQQDIVNSDSVDGLLTEISTIVKQTPGIEVTITGGETFLYHDLNRILDAIPISVPVSIWTGLGVNENRFEKILNRLTHYPQLKIVVSVENIKKLYEFNRWGNTWARFETNLGQIQKKNISYSFNATISNLTLFGLLDFYSYAKNTPITFESCTDPEFLAINVLDPTSKSRIIDQLDKLPLDSQTLILKSIGADVTPQQHVKCSKYLKEFAQRRGLQLDVFPDSFVNWINNV